MDPYDRDLCEDAHHRTARDRLDFIDTELGSGQAFAAVAKSHYGFGERLEARHALVEAAKALEQAAEAIRVAKQEGHATTQFDSRAMQLKLDLDALYARDPHAARSDTE